VDPAATEMLDWSKLQPGVGDLAKVFVDRFRAKHPMREMQARRLRSQVQTN
jgi:branched-chain amino acid transport system substrate-binding protein